ncbi:MAG: hypothetical protein HY854_17430 [Burkholderiales bacterium]|nr:hypothetical protein [Burkholderiales bacterium]
MTQPVVLSAPADVGTDTLPLRRSERLAYVPPERLPPASPVSTAEARTLDAPERGSSLELPSETRAAWGLGAVASMAAIGWLIERRRRRLAEMEKDSVLWANVQPPGSSIITTAGNLDDILPDSPDPAEKARAIYVTQVGETNSRREATLIDLHQLHGKLRRRRDRGDIAAAVLLLQQHLVDFRYTSPWVFLELRELYQLMGRQPEWDVARITFRQRFGQNAPLWDAPATDHKQLVDDAQLSRELSRLWPYREARIFFLRWMLGDPDMRHKNSGPPLLPLGVYRDMMLLDQVLDDEVMVIRPQKVADSLL